MTFLDCHRKVQSNPKKMFIYTDKSTFTRCPPTNTEALNQMKRFLLPRRSSSAAYSPPTRHFSFPFPTSHFPFPILPLIRMDIT